MLNFGEALERAKKGRKITRTGWNGKGMWVEIQAFISHPDNVGPTPLPYLVLFYPPNSTAHPNGAVVPWLASQTDILAEDWMEVQ